MRTTRSARRVRTVRVILAASLLGGAVVSSAGAQEGARSPLVATLDSLAAAHAEDTLVAGISVAVVHHGQMQLLKSYGVADLEWDVPMPTDAIFEIGSVTKQFTAAAVTQLVEQGRLDLDADMTTYLPDYDTQGRHIPLHRLLDHTSGIKGYTEIPAFGEIVMRELPRDSLVVRFEAVPLEFEPGTAQIYNNSAYFLLGLIIEKVSGGSYGSYVAEHLFKPLGVARSSYCDQDAILFHRAHGYDQGAAGLQQKGYLNHLWPYAAGSLCSTAADLVTWNQALHGGKVVSAESYRYMITPQPLEDGTPIRYGTGLMVLDDNGRKAITHGGGINGFLSDVWYYPDEELLVVVLQNSAGQKGPGLLARSLVKAVIGPGPEPVVTPYGGDLRKLAGSYRGPSRGREMTVEVTVEEGVLVLKPVGASQATKPRHESGLRWWSGNTLWFFRTGADGTGTTLHMDAGGGHNVLTRTEG